MQCTPHEGYATSCHKDGVGWGVCVLCIYLISVHGPSPVDIENFFNNLQLWSKCMWEGTRQAIIIDSGKVKK